MDNATRPKLVDALKVGDTVKVEGVRQLHTVRSTAYQLLDGTWVIGTSGGVFRLDDVRSPHENLR